MRIEFYSKDNFGFKYFALSTINYGDSHNMRFGYGMRLNSIEKIASDINQKIPFSPPLGKNEPSLVFDHNMFHGIKTDGGFPYMENEQDVINNMKIVTDFTEKTALPLLQLFTDVREIDKRINGEGENFWRDSWQKPFGLTEPFSIRRRILAKLSGRKDYEEFIEKLYNLIDENLQKEGKEKFDRTNLNNATNYCVHLLKDVKPLY